MSNFDHTRCKYNFIPVFTTCTLTTTQLCPNRQDVICPTEYTTITMAFSVQITEHSNLCSKTLQAQVLYIDPTNIFNKNFRWSPGTLEQVIHALKLHIGSVVKLIIIFFRGQLCVFIVFNDTGTH